MEGILYVIASPIGNLKDISIRALEVLTEVDVIFAETISHTKKLLFHYGIKNQVLAYNDKNKENQLHKIVWMLQQGRHLALISNAGTPAISDPGYRVIKECRAKDIKVVPIPGPSALTSSLSVSGFPIDKFQFIGFLPVSQEKKKTVIKKMLADEITTVFFETARRIFKTLEIFHEIDPTCELLVARELTKVYESTRVGSPEQVSDFLLEESINHDLKGELTLILKKKEDSEKASDQEIETAINAEMSKKRHLSTKDLACVLSERFKISKKVAYSMVLSHNKKVDKLELDNA